MIAAGNYAPRIEMFSKIQHQHKIIDRCIIDSEEYWKAIAKLGELLSKKEDSDRPVFTEDDMVTGFF